MGNHSFPTILHKRIVLSRESPGWNPLRVKPNKAIDLSHEIFIYDKSMDLFCAFVMEQDGHRCENYFSEWMWSRSGLILGLRPANTGFRLAMSERGSNGLTVFRIRGPNGITKSPYTFPVFVFVHLAVNPFRWLIHLLYSIALMLY